MIFRIASSIFLALAIFAPAQAGENAEKKPVSFYRDIRPVFQARCYGCHQPSKAKGKYVMTDHGKMLAGGESDETAIVPKDPAKSYLVELIVPVDGEAEMPSKKKPLHETEIALIKRWIAEGATDDTPDNARERYDMDHPPVYHMPPIIISIDYSPDGKWLAVAGFHEVLLHNADGSGIEARLVGLSERIESVRFSPDGKKLAVTGGLPGRMGEVQIWDVGKRKLDLSVPVTYDTVYGASWSPDGQYVAFGCGDNSARAIDAKTGKEVFFQGSHNDWVFDTVFSKDGKHLVSVGRDMTAKLSVFEEQRFIDNITSITPGALKGGIATVQRHPDKDEILVGGSDGAPKTYKMFRTKARKIGDDYNLLKKFEAMTGRIFNVAYNHDGNYLAAVSSLDGKGQVRVYMTGDGKKQWNRDLDTAVYAVDFSPDGKTVAAAGADGKIRLLDAANGEINTTFVPVEISAEANPSTDDKLSVVHGNANEIEHAELLPEGRTVTSLKIVPEKIELLRKIDYAQILIMATLDSGDTVDVTRMAEVKVDQGVATVTPRGIVSPVKDGQGKLTASFKGKHQSISLSIAGVNDSHKPDYVRDLMPVLSQMGCNAGTCHGAKDGRNGFKLSLRGYDPIYDVRAFTDDLSARRVNLASPDDSLMLLKATGAVPHEGDQRTPHGSKYYNLVRDWIANGAKLNLDTPRVTGIELYPVNPTVQRTGSRQQMRVIATYADGVVRDITSEAFVSSGNGDVAKSDASGLVTTLRRGEAPILARFEGAYAATTLTVMGDRSGFEWEEPPGHNKIDDFVAAKWKRMKILPSGLCTDAEFFRRVHLDLTGLPPSADKVRAFLADKRETRVKRDELIDQLVGSPEYIDHWANKWADLLQVNRKFLGAQGAKNFRDWIHSQVEKNTPYDEFVSTILTSTGSNKDNPPASYFKILRKPEDIMENTTHLFLATRFNCNKCHDHPFERWTQDQYFEMAAYFAQVELKRDPASGKGQIGKTAVEAGKPMYEIVSDKKNADIKHERTGKVAPPTFPYESKQTSPEGATRRQQLADWITSTDNMYFARSYVNRLWGYMTGTGIIEPIDDIRAGNPPTNPELLDWLAREFIAHEFDVRHVLKTICKSRTYQLSIKTNQWNEDDAINYSHAKSRRLPAEVLYDTIYRVTGSKLNIPGVPPGTRAAALPDVGIKLPDGFLNNLGRPPRESACECERVNDLQLGPIMALVSGPTVDKAITSPNNALQQLVNKEADDRKLIDELFLRILNRHASSREIDSCLEIMNGIDADHEQLTGALADYEAKMESIVASREKARQDRIDEARADLAAYEAGVKDREAELDRQRNEKIAMAEQVIQDYEISIPTRIQAWAKDPSRRTEWSILDPEELSTSFEAKLERQDDLSIFASGKNGKGTYTIIAPTGLKQINGLRLEALPDSRLPKSGPGRAGSGNFVLTELTASIVPVPNHRDWKPLKEWTFDQDKTDWIAQNGALATLANGAISVEGKEIAGTITIDPWHHIGPFTGGNPFEKKYEPETKPFDPNQELAEGNKKFKWTARPQWKDGVVYNELSGENSANYLFRKIHAPQARSLNLSLGSDDGIKLFVNGKQVLANNIGRGAAADQEKVTIQLSKGENHILMKIVNQGGPTGFYFASDAKTSSTPALANKISAPKGSFVLELESPGDELKQAMLYWATTNKNSFDGNRAVKAEAVAGKERTYAFKFTATNDLRGLQLDFGKLGRSPLRLASAKLYTAGLPQTIAFKSSKADFSQQNYGIGTAINGKSGTSNDGWAIHPQPGKDHVAVFAAKNIINIPDGMRVKVEFNQQYTDGTHTLGRFRLSVTASDMVDFGITEAIASILKIPRDQRSKEQAQELATYYKSMDEELKKLQAALTEARKPRPMDPKLKSFRDRIVAVSKPLPVDAKYERIKREVELSKNQKAKKRLTATQDIAWALINTPAFLYNH